ncbi:MAG: hypothetical protein WCP28_05930 [Actinomycetes bacterium]
MRELLDDVDGVETAVGVSVVDADALAGFKFSSLLPPALRAATLAERMTDPVRPAIVAAERVEVGWNSQRD